ncbi:MAG TPA: aldose 1-epimerase family protein [Gaiellaceae bacterium]|nr:aldose 1-epimerase family protein [Gaiellaceae bacterium]
MNPSGEQVELAFGEQRAVVVGVGAGLRTYSVEGRPVIDGYDADELCHAGRGQLLVPWPNRIEDGSYEFGGHTHQLALNEPARQNAIHGLVRWAHWSIADRAADRVAFEHVLYPQPGYPFALELRVEYSLSEDGLTVRTGATNASPEAAPYGAGSHPYLAVEQGVVDGVELRVPAATVLIADERGLPVGSAAVADEGLDFRESRPVGPARLDHCFTDLERDGRGRAEARLGTTTLWADESYPYLMVFTGDPLPDVARRSLAVEPMTCAPNAFRSGEGLIRLEPGQAHAGSWGIRP